MGFALCTAPVAAQGKVFLTTKEALALAFPGCEVRRETHYLDREQQARVAALSGERFDRGVVFSYAASKDGKPVGTAYFDVHRVRTLRETLMVVVTPEGKVGRVEVLAFGEPLDYLPRANFYAQFTGRALDAELRLKGAIHGVTGATLTARATVSAVRRVLALHRVLQAPPEPPAPEKEKKGQKGGGGQRGRQDRGAQGEGK